MMFLSLFFIESALSFFVQVPGQKPGENLGTSDASAIMDGAVEGSRLIVSSFHKEWEYLGNGESEIYKALVVVSLSIATVLVAFWSVGWYQEIVNHGFSTKVINEIIYPLVVIIMLSNNGMLLANVSLLLREISNGVNDNILNITRNEITYREAIRATNFNKAFVANLQARLAECESKPEKTLDSATGEVVDTLRACKDRAIQNAKQEADAYRKKKGLSFSPPDLKFWQIPGELANAGVQSILFVLLSGCEAAFQYVVQIAFLLNAYIAPLFLVLSLFPTGSRPIFAWLSGWLSLGLILISYSIMIGLAASAVVNNPPTNPLFLPLLQGVFSPFLALGIGVGGGMSSFSGFTSIAKIIIKKI